MVGSSRDHERGAHLPDELCDILRSLSESQTNILYYALTNHHDMYVDIFLRCCRTESLRLQRIIQEELFLMNNGYQVPKLRPPITSTISSRPSSEVASYRPPSTSMMWRPNIMSYVVSRSPLPPPASSPTEDEHPVPSSSSSVKAFCAKATGTSTVPDLPPRNNSRRSNRSRPRSRSSGDSHLS